MPRGRPYGIRNAVQPWPLGVNAPKGWTKKLSSFPWLRNHFNTLKGPQIPSNFGECTPLNAFQLMFSWEVAEAVLKRTGLKLGANRMFVPSHEDLHRFIIASLIMCINVRRDWRQHWSSDQLYSNTAVQNLLTLQRFRWMLKNLHPKPAKLWKLANRNFQKYWKPYDHVSIDETLIPFKGRYKYRVHIRGKPKATGIKLYCLADERNYMYNIEQYRAESGRVEDIVERQLRTLPSKRYKVYCDAYYGSERLARILLRQGYWFNMACGVNKPGGRVCVINL